LFIDVGPSTEGALPLPAQSEHPWAFGSEVAEEAILAGFIPEALALTFSAGGMPFIAPVFEPV
jgi:hypothetical protein